MATIYTGRGDQGQTDLFSGERVSKTEARIEAYGTVDELNTVIGLSVSILNPEDDGDLKEQLILVQNRLHSICADLANTRPSPKTPRIQESQVEQLEEWIDALEEEMNPLTQFILPGGEALAARLQHARAVCRRAERRTVAAWKKEQHVHPNNLKYLNRLSDFLFVMARYANHREDTPERYASYD